MAKGCIAGLKIFLMKITNIKPQQKRQNRVNIFVDGVFSIALSSSLVLDYNLFPGKEISQSDLDLLKSAEEEARALEKAYHLLSFRMRSEGEIKKRLSSDFPPQVIEKVLKRLKKYKYINDQDFAQRWTRERQSSRGKRMLQFELLSKGVDLEAVSGALSEIGPEQEFENALNFILGKKKNLLKVPDGDQKILSLLSRRGFSYEVGRRVLKEINEKTP
jgi:regulatory protein